MEHFSRKEIDKILGNFHGILKKNGRIILLWPAKWNIINNLFPNMFPDMPSTLSSKKEAESILKKNKFNKLAINSTIMGDYIIVARK